MFATTPFYSFYKSYHTKTLSSLQVVLLTTIPKYRSNLCATFGFYTGTFLEWSVSHKIIVLRRVKWTIGVEAGQNSLASLWIFYLESFFLLWYNK